MIGAVIALFLAVLAVVTVVSARGAADRGPKPFSRTPAHYRRAYSRRGFLRLGVASAGAALMANTRIDGTIEAWHRDEVRSPATDKMSDVFRPGGERYWFLYWATFAVGDAFLGSSPLTRWGRSAVEAMVVGLPALWTIQRVAGASRPTDPPGNSHWRPMADDNAASGHTFMAAIPWLIAARRAGGTPARLAAYAASLPTGWSRLNDRKHYLSQVLLGYTIAWNAVDAVDGDAGHASGRD